MSTSRPPAPRGALTHADTIGVVGTGTLGAGIAQVAAQAGHRVVLYDGELARSELVGRLLVAERGVPADRVRVAGALGELSDCAMVIEAVTEDLSVKRDVLATVEKAIAEDAVLASNSSTRSVTLLARALRIPRRLVGLHFLRPAEDTPAVEVVRAALTSPAVLERTCATVRSWSRVPILCEMSPGLVIDRTAGVMHTEAQRIVEERVTTAAVVDHLMRRAGGFPLGPLEFGDRNGHDHCLDVARSIWEQTFHDPRYAPSMLRQRLVDAGWYGVRSGRGVYRYDVAPDHPDGPRAPVPVHPRALPPPRVEYADGLSVMEPLLDRMAAGGVAVRLTEDEGADGTLVEGLRLPSGGRLVETHGPRARELGDEVVVIDWALDPALTEIVAFATAANCSPETRNEAVGALQAARVEVVEVADSPGLVVARNIAMMINEAVDIVDRQECRADAVDAALSLGLGYPRGPVSWGEQLGPACLVSVLDALHDLHPTGRYRVSPALRLAAESGSALGR